MVFYAIGSLLFGIALVAALATVFAGFVQYRTQMLFALRSLSLDGIHGHKSAATAPYPVGPAVSARRDRPVRPAPRLAA